MFAKPAALLFFVSKELADRKPFQRFLKLTLVGSHHSSKRWRELRPQRNFALTFVHEMEKLIHDFDAAFFLVKLGRFEYRAVPLDEPVAARDFAPNGDDVIAHRAIRRQKIAETRKRLHYGS